MKTTSGMACTLSLLLLSLAASLPAQKLDMDKLHGLKARSIGPAGMSGRVTAIDAVVANPDIIYVGTASGGLWKSTSGGIAWKPVFDEQRVASVGAVAIVQQNPDVVYVGTGEGNPRNSKSSGNGVYKTLDGGMTWTHLGLEKSRTIHRVLVDPRDENVIYVAAQGPAWGEGSERGIYKTTDGGKSWRKILYVDEKTGAADLVMDPNNPNKLVAAMWQFRRWPWFFKSGGPGSGLYVTNDGGENWKHLSPEDGLPDGELGRIGLAIAPSRPNIVYALVEAKKNAFYRSDDGGGKWHKVSDKNIGNRPFYYADIFVDPQNENRIYNLYSVVDVSEDGGRTFRTLVPWNDVHPDHHAFWIHPQDTDFLMDGSDGGLAISRDRGKSWRFVTNLPLAQFYHINFDWDTPYHVYGGMQDNGSWRGPSKVWRYNGIRNAYWQEVAFGDGFDVAPDPSDSRYGFAMSQGGFLRRYDVVTGHQKFIRPVHPDGIPLRFNWNAGLAIDPFDGSTLYFGSQFLHMSRDRGNSWKVISPDLTTNDPAKQKQLESGGLTYDVTAAENFTSIVAVAPSPVERGVIWVGTDDGNVQLTRDGGKSWANVVRNIKGVPAGTWVPQIHASTYDAAHAFVVFDNHRRNDWTPYLFYTANFGKSWKRLAGPEEVWGFTLSVVQDPVEPKLLFLGTEFGLYVSLDFGKSWNKWKAGYPTVSTMDMRIHPRENDLVIGTFGRAAYIIDDIRPLRALVHDGPGLLQKPVHVFDVADAVLAERQQASGTRFAASAEFSGENIAYGALIRFVYNRPDSATGAVAGKKAMAKKATEDTVKVQILDSEHKLIRTFKAAAKPGINRTSWNLKRDGLRDPDDPKPKPDALKPEGPEVPPGTYLVRIKVGGTADSAKVNVLPDPRLPVADVGRAAKEALLQRLYKSRAVATEAADRLRAAQKTIRAFKAQLEERDDDVAKNAIDAGKAAEDSIKAVLEKLYPKEVQGIWSDMDLPSVRLDFAEFYLRSSLGEPGETARLMLEQTEVKLKATLPLVNDFFSGTWQKYRQAVEAARPSFFEEYAPLKIE